MGDKDIAEKHLEEYNDVFADIINVLIFGGRIVVQEEDLSPLTSERSAYRTEAAKTGKTGRGRIREQERDIAKLWEKGKLALSVLGLENQSGQDKDMPLRVIAYDGASYRSELNGNPGFRVPVLTLVLCYQDRRWSAPKSIYEAVPVPEDLKPYVHDYPINLVEIAWLEPETVRLFRSDFRFVAEYFVQKRLREDYHPSDQVIRHVDATLKLMSAITGDRRFEEIYNDRVEKASGEEEPKMEEMLDRIENRGEVRGIAIGEARGEARGISLGRQQERESNTLKVADLLMQLQPDMTREQALQKAASTLQD